MRVNEMYFINTKILLTAKTSLHQKQIQPQVFSKRLLFIGVFVNM